MSRQYLKKRLRQLIRITWHKIFIQLLFVSSPHSVVVAFSPLVCLYSFGSIAFSFVRLTLYFSPCIAFSSLLLTLYSLGSIAFSFLIFAVYYSDDILSSFLVFALCCLRSIYISYLLKHLCYCLCMPWRIPNSVVYYLHSDVIACP